MTVVRHELIFSVRDVDGRELQVGGLILLDKPLERHRVPHDLTLGVAVGLQDGILHVFVAFGIAAPSVVLHQVVAETALVYDDAIFAQVSDSPDLGL